MVIAIGIETELWSRIIRMLRNEGWKVLYKYDNFDAGIDFDFIILKKDSEEILFAWDNWFEGEIKCREDQMKHIEQHLGITFKLGEPENLKPEIIELYRKQAN
ncbi:hypothetical protein [Pontibacter burrus]|uniref:Uncharacterized protein n=1 Tax=Pontibacter burrus TaxID=2704466 RepID=A0A6B3LS73_9BACT|nr:hypothetical protein [Pontibacter burrus]NEM96340.1 hypothetical protein [Pontibacter burrus]